jgi:hypothetical protein
MVTTSLLSGRCRARTKRKSMLRHRPPGRSRMMSQHSPVVCPGRAMSRRLRAVEGARRGAGECQSFGSSRASRASRRTGQDTWPGRSERPPHCRPRRYFDPWNRKPLGPTGCWPGSCGPEMSLPHCSVKCSGGDRERGSPTHVESTKAIGRRRKRPPVRARPAINRWSPDASWLGSAASKATAAARRRRRHRRHPNACVTY